MLCSALCLLTPSHMLPSPCTSPTPLEAGGWGLTKSLGQTWANFLKSCLQLSALFSPHLLPCCRRPKCSAYTTSSPERLSPPPPPPTCLTRSCHNPGSHFLGDMMDEPPPAETLLSIYHLLACSVEPFAFQQVSWMRWITCCQNGK